MKKQTIALLLSAAVMTMALSACGGPKSNGSGSDDANTSRADNNEIAVGISQDLGDSLDPYQMTAAGTREILFNVYEGLYKPTSSGDFEPALAESYAVSEDGRVYTFTIRQGVLFHNETPMDVNDVVYSFNTCAATSVDSSLGAALSNVASVEAANENTVVVTLKEPDSDFLAYVASVYIVPDDYSDQATAPVGTGPFKYVSRSVQENLVLEKFDGYWGEGAKVDRVTFMIYENSSALMTALNGGAVDLAMHLTVSQTQNLDERYNVLEGTMNLVQALYLNNAVAPFDDVRVRQALCYAIDRDAILELTADGHGTKLGSSMYPAFTKYFDDSLTDYYTYDPEKAKELLTEAGYPNGFTMTITVPSNYTPHVDTAQVLVEQLGAVGITVEIEEVEWNTWLQRTYTERDFQSTVVGFDAANLTANALLQRWTSDSEKNMINFSNAEYDSVMAQANATTDDAARTALFKQAERILTEEAANVYIQDLADMVAINKNLTGFEFYPLYVLDLSNIAYVQ
ncbi:MAG TPA: ABC transporter substrate-binding protein [Firmicutes bacterium]|nr:ABC transporter substrate-binding protein [Bacillota bacterium]